MNVDSDKKKKFARIGIATKGVVYCLVGVLTAMAAFGQGGQKTGTKSTLDVIAGQPFGQILLVITGIGLLGYVFYRFYQTFADTENEGDDKTGIGKRIAYFSSGAFYGFLAFLAFKKVIGAASSGSGSGGKKQLIGTLLEAPMGQILVGIIALIFLGKALYQFYIAFSGKYKDKLKKSNLGEKAEKALSNAGMVGYISRGIVVGIVAVLIGLAAINHNPNEAGGTEEAFSVLQNTFGSVVLGVIAIGLVAYGVFMFVKARYKAISLE
jgi:hypothetical protein